MKKKTFIIAVIALIAVIGIKLNGQIEPPKHGDPVLKIPPKDEISEGSCSATVSCPKTKERPYKIRVRCFGTKSCKSAPTYVECDGKKKSC